MAERILIVDDDVTLINLIATILEIEGFQAQKALSGAEALEAIAKDPPDLVLLDIMMPEMDGFEVLIELRSRPATEKLPVVILTVLSDDEDILGGWARKTDAYVIKPFENRELLDTIKAVLDRSQEERLEERARRVDSLLEILQKVDDENDGVNDGVSP